MAGENLLGCEGCIGKMDVVGKWCPNHEGDMLLYRSRLYERMCMEISGELQGGSARQDRRFAAFVLARVESEQLVADMSQSEIVAAAVLDSHASGNQRTMQIPRHLP